MRLCLLLALALATVALCAGKRPTTGSSTAAPSSGKSTQRHSGGPAKDQTTATTQHSGKGHTIKEPSTGGKFGKMGKTGKMGKMAKGAAKSPKNFQAGKPGKAKEPVAQQEAGQLEKPVLGAEKELAAPEIAVVANADLDKKTPAEEAKKDQENAAAGNVDFDESLLTTETVTELASLRAELAAAKELAGLRTAVAEQQRLKERADRAARKTAFNATRPAKAKKCLDISFTGQDETTGEATPVVLERCSCSCRPAAPANATAEAPAGTAQIPAAAAPSEEPAETTPSLDQI